MQKRIALTLAIALAVSGAGWAVARDGEPRRADPVPPGLTLPPGFRINLFAEGLEAPRFMAFDPKGRLMVAEIRAGRVTVLPDQGHRGRADRKIVFASGMNLPHSIAWHKGRAYIACLTQVIRCTDVNGDGVADRREVVVDGLAGGGGHSTRTIVFGADGGIYVSVGSATNVGPETDRRRAVVLRFDADGSHGRIYASGLRNAVGMAVHPVTGRIWVTVNERDMLGDDLPPDRLDILRDAGFHGWPYVYFFRGKPNPSPEYSDTPRSRQALRSAIPPVLEFQAHSAPLGIAFYTGDQFPKEYRGDAFVAFHGSWNRTVPTGYKVVRVRVKDNKPVSYEDFVSGFLSLNPVEKRGRPAGVVAGPDGSLYVSDDAEGRIYRVTYR
jgi:putative membrane-bound dehydrogenase-like protein